MPNIRSRETVAERLWDWGFLNAAFPGQIRPMDLDGIVEKNGQFLVLEGKPLGHSLPTGQKITLEKMAAKDDFCVVVLFGEPGQPEQMKVLGHHDMPIDCTKADVVRLVEAWIESVM